MLLARESKKYVNKIVKVKTMDQIIIRNLKVFAHHGVLAEEKKNGQDFFVNAILEMDLRKAALDDNLNESVNYDEASHLIVNSMQEETFDTIEAAAETTARHLLLEYPVLKNVTIQIGKPHAPIQLDFDTVLVKLKRGWHTAFLGIGSNMGDRKHFLQYAVDQLGADESIRVEKVSTFVNTEPYGPVEQDDFLNGVLEVSTLLTPHELLSVANDIEKEAGRERKVHWGPRTLDIDILFYDDWIVSDERLRIPHPEIAKRTFVLEPMCEIAPYYRHPIQQKTVSELLDHLGRHATEREDIELNYEEVPSLDMEDATVVYAGVPGAYAEEAANRYFGKQVQYCNVKTFADVVNEVAEGKADFGVIPIENSSAGFVAGNYDIIREGGISIIAEVVVDIHHALLGLPDSSLTDIKKVYSHPQGIMQCREFIEEHDYTAESVTNTALAAKKVRDKGDPTAAAIASERAGKLYDLKVLKKHINFQNDNSTKFVVVVKNRICLSDATNISICFTTKHKVGALYDIMGIFFHNRLNMTSIESRPSLKHKWEYMFYVDFEGKLTDRNVQKALGEINANSDELLVLGTY